MYLLPLQHVIKTRLFLSSASLLFGLGIWNIITHLHTQTRSLNIPIYFYNTQEYTTINSPENAYVTLRATRAQFRAIEREKATLQIDAQELKIGSQLIPIQQKNLLLPSDIILVNYTPIPVTLH